MTLDDIRPGKQERVLATTAEVDGLESRLWATFPAGYRDYVTRVGEGVLGSTVRVYPPWRIAKELAEWRRRIGKYWFWDEGRDVLPKERALECVIVAETANGDELVFHPGRPGRLFVLPRDSESIFPAGEDLLSDVEWMLTSGELGEAVTDRDFEPFDSRVRAADKSGDGASADPEGESLDAIADLARRWAERHQPTKAAQKAVKEHVNKGQSAKKLYEALVLDGDMTHGTGYTVGFAISDKAGGKTVALFRWHTDGESEGSSYEPVK